MSFQSIPFLSPGDLLVTRNRDGNLRVLRVTGEGITERVSEAVPADAAGTDVVIPQPPPEPAPTLDLPHSRACGIRYHPHGIGCSTDCPTCHGRPWDPPTKP